MHTESDLRTVLRAEEIHAPDPSLVRARLRPAGPTPPRHGWKVVAVAAAVLLVVGVAVAVPLLLNRGGSDKSVSPPLSSSGLTTSASMVPAGLQLQDEGERVTLQWRGSPDVSHFITLDKNGGTPSFFGTVKPGQSDVTIDGLDPKANYCFRVAAVLPGGNNKGPVYAVSAPICTHRGQGPHPT